MNIQVLCTRNNIILINLIQRVEFENRVENDTQFSINNGGFCYSTKEPRLSNISSVNSRIMPKNQQAPVSLSLSFCHFLETSHNLFLSKQ